jgi:hypothetical protein
MRKTFSKSFLTSCFEAVPGKRFFGIYRFVLGSFARLIIIFHRFLPFFFGLGAALEFSMINWTVGETNFYKSYKKRVALNHLEEARQQEEQTH